MPVLILLGVKFLGQFIIKKEIVKVPRNKGEAGKLKTL